VLNLVTTRITLVQGSEISNNPTALLELNQAWVIPRVNKTKARNTLSVELKGWALKFYRKNFSPWPTAEMAHDHGNEQHNRASKRTLTATGRHDF
jgi:hypothetical protein